MEPWRRESASRSAWDRLGAAWLIASQGAGPRRVRAVDVSCSSSDGPRVKAQRTAINRYARWDCRCRVHSKHPAMAMPRDATPPTTDVVALWLTPPPNPFRPGSAMPLASADPRYLAHRHSVARSVDPHAETKLSSAHGLRQEQDEHTLALGRPGSERPISSSH